MGEIGFQCISNGMFFSHALIHGSATWIAERFPCQGPCWLAGVFGPGI